MVVECVDVVRRVEWLELTRFGGHLIVGFGGIHHGGEDGPVHTGV